MRWTAEGCHRQILLGTLTWSSVIDGSGPAGIPLLSRFQTTAHLPLRRPTLSSGPRVPVGDSVLRLPSSSVERGAPVRLALAMTAHDLFSRNEIPQRQRRP
jgi:hypothetical protein